MAKNPLRWDQVAANNLLADLIRNDKPKLPISTPQ